MSNLLLANKILQQYREYLGVMFLQCTSVSNLQIYSSRFVGFLAVLVASVEVWVVGVLLWAFCYYEPVSCSINDKLKGK
jgi:hypothetical protein